MAKLRFDVRREFSDAREAPLYSIPVAAHYLQLPVATLRSWVLGRKYPTKGDVRQFKRIIEPALGSDHLLSFFNLAEAHVLSAVRRIHQLPLPNIRAALRYVAHEFNTKHPLIDQKFRTDGVSLFIERLGRLINATENGQIVMREFFEQHLARIEWKDNLAFRLYPFTRPGHAGPKTVVIDPRYSFGRPVLLSTRIPTLAIAERYKAGESVAELADDYACAPLDIEEALRCELRLDAA